MEVIRWSKPLTSPGMILQAGNFGWFYGGWRRCNSGRFPTHFWILRWHPKKKHLLPRNLTWNLKMMVSKRNFLFWGLLFRFHDKFRRCKTKSLLATEKKTKSKENKLVSLCHHFSEAFACVREGPPTLTVWIAGKQMAQLPCIGLPWPLTKQPFKLRHLVSPQCIHNIQICVN